MTDKIIEYRTVSSPNIALMAIKHFEKKYHCDYRWGFLLVRLTMLLQCVLETEDNFRCITTTSRMSYIVNRRTVKTFEDIGEL